MYMPLHELEQLANQYFSEPNYQEDSRSNLDNPSGYMSIGNLSDGARQARVIIGTDKAGLIRLEATADSEEDLDQHLEQFQIIIDALNLKNTSLFDGSSDTDTKHESDKSSTQSNEEDADSAPAETISDDSNNTVYTDSKTKVSLNYPSSWKLFEEEFDVEFSGPMGAVFMAITSAPMRELDELADDFFSGPEYQEESRSTLDNPSGYMSIGDLRDGARQVRVILGNEQVGLIIFEATSDPEDFDLHLLQFQTILASLELPETDIVVNSDGNEHNDQVEDYGPTTITILNISNASTTQLESWAALAESKMASRKANILAVLWPVGDFIREGGFSHPFNQHEVLITSEEADFLIDEIDMWLNTQTCMKENPEFQHEELETYRDWLERGADASTQLSLCPGTRLIMMGLASHHRDQNDPVGLRDLQEFFTHELYHAFQQDLASRSCEAQTGPESNTPWIVEGGANYFSKFMSAEINGESDPVNPVSDILLNALNLSEREGTNIFQGGSSSGAAALQFLVEIKALDKDSILDGSLFHDCAREKEYSNDNPNVVAAIESWHLIEQRNGAYKFSEEAFSNAGATDMQTQENSSVNQTACNQPVEFVLKTYGSVEEHKIDSVKQALNTIDLVNSGVNVPVYVVLWEVNDEKGVSKTVAEQIAADVVPEMYPDNDNDQWIHVTEDIVGKTQKETITADLYHDACAGGIFAAATNTMDFPNYLGKITFHEFHHIYQSSFYRNNPDGHREQPPWITEGMAETYGMLEAIKSGWTDNVYLEQTLENARQRIARNPNFADLSIFQDEFGDHWPVHSTEIGMVAVDYIMKNYVGSQSFDQFAYALY
jgi:hypothetical protein